MKFIVYSLDDCPWCEKAKAALTKEGHEYTELNVTAPEKRAEFKEKYPELKTLPQIFLEEETLDGYIGGHDKLIVWIRKNPNVEDLWD